MDMLLTILGLFCITLGILGALLPILPGPPISWIGLLLLYGTRAVPNDNKFIWITLGIAILVTLLDYIIPVVGTKKFGGTKKGIWGSTIGLVIGLFFPPIGIIVGPFIGAFIGELIEDSADIQKAFKAAVGSFIGFVFSTGLKLVLGGFYFYYFMQTFWTYKSDIFSFS
ncbi:DUF456 domain-containing protein [Flavicella marina]|uniref:DUF456 domain-containing protein n=1 Tax=Flavicella marina TaxID=1475951 RepID=UPI001263FE12|nr:DUF456 domain-containing protein [Flavicella marina]